MRSSRDETLLVRRQRRAHYKGTTTRLTSPLQPVFLHRSSIDTGTPSEWQSPPGTRDEILHSKTEMSVPPNLTLVGQVFAMADTRKWQQNGEKQARVDLTLEWSCWTDAGNPALVFKRRDALLMRPLPSPLSNNKGITNIGGVCVYSPNVSTKLSDRDCGTYIELRRLYSFSCTHLKTGRGTGKLSAETFKWAGASESFRNWGM